jgi:hypothetical protein
MQSFLTQIISILTTNPGILVYHTVVAFSIAAALPVAVYQWRTTGLPQGRRMVIGLSLLLLTRLVLFLVAGLAAQEILLQENLLQIQPALDRAVMLIDLILIIWLWAFPEPERMGDSAAMLLAMLTLLVSIFGLLWWSGQGTTLPFNGSLPDFIGDIYALLLLAIGILVLLLRRPDGWGNGLVMLIVLLIGHSANFLFPLNDQDFEGAVRLAEMIAYPLLLTLPQRSPGRRGAGLAGETAQGVGQGAALFGSDPQLLQSFLLLATGDSAERTLPAVCRLAGQRLQAELCLIAAAGEGSDRLLIERG